MKKIFNGAAQFALLAGSLLSAQSSFALDEHHGSYKMLAQYHNGAETTVLKSIGPNNGGDLQKAAEDAETKCRDKQIPAFEKSNDPAADQYQKRVEGFHSSVSKNTDGTYTENCEIRYLYFAQKTEPKQTSLAEDYINPNSLFKRVGAYAPGSGAETLTSKGPKNGGDIDKEIEAAEIKCLEKQVPRFEKSGKLVEGFDVTVYPNYDGSYQEQCTISYAFYSAENVPSGY